MPAAHGDDLEVEALQPREESLALDEPGQFADSQAVGHRDRVESGERGEGRLQDETGHILSPQGVGAVEDHQGDARLGSCLHGQAKGGDVGVEAYADVLDVEQQQVDGAQHGGGWFFRGAIEGVYRYAGAGVPAFPDRYPVFRLAAQTVLRREEGGQPHRLLPLQQVDQMCIANPAGLVGDEADPLSGQ